MADRFTEYSYLCGRKALSFTRHEVQPFLLGTLAILLHTVWRAVFGVRPLLVRDRRCYCRSRRGGTRRVRLLCVLSVSDLLEVLGLHYFQYS